MTKRIVIHGEQFVTFTDAAGCFGLSLEWVEELNEHGLLGETRQTEAGIALAATLLDRLATIRRLQLQQALSLPEIARWLDLLDR